MAGYEAGSNDDSNNENDDNSNGSNSNGYNYVARFDACNYLVIVCVSVIIHYKVRKQGQRTLSDGN